MTEPGPLLLSRRARVCAATTALAGLAWLPHLTRRLLATDDYVNLAAPGLGWTVEASVAQGRFVGALLQLCSYWLGIDPARSAPLTQLIALALCGVAGLALVRLWGLEDEPAPAQVLVAALPFVHPVAFELWTFHIMPPYVVLAQGLALWGLWLVLREDAPRPWAGVALLVAALGIYQVALNVALVVLALGGALGLSRHPPGSAERRRLLRSHLGALALLVLACAIWAVINKSLLLAFHLAPEWRNGLWDGHAAAARLREVARTLARVAFRERQLGTPLLGALQLSLVALAAGGVAWRTRGQRALRELALTLALFAAALLSVVGILALVKDFQAPPRTLLGAGYLWAGALALAVRAGAAPRFRRAALAVGTLCLLGSIGVDHRAAEELGRLNQRDLQVAARVLARFEAEPAYARMRRVVTVGHSINSEGLPTVAAFVAPSALAISWSQAPLFSELADRHFDDATEADVAAAAQLCREAPRWPAAGSTSITADGLGVVCF